MIRRSRTLKLRVYDIIHDAVSGGTESGCAEAWRHGVPHRDTAAEIIEWSIMRWLGEVIDWDVPGGTEDLPTCPSVGDLSRKGKR